MYSKGNSSPKNKGKGKLHQMEFLGTSTSTSIFGRGTGTAVQSGGFRALGSGAAQNSGVTNLLKQVEQLLAASNEKINGIKKKLKNSHCFLDRLGIIASIDAIILLFWLQTYIVVTVNLWRNAVASLVFWFFF